MRRILLLLLLAACGNGDGSRTTPAVPSPRLEAEQATPLRIMPLGDSITQADSEHDSYRRPLFKTLELEGRSVDFVGSERSNHGGDPPHPDFDMDHEGHWGWRVGQILREIHSWARAEEPDVLLVHLGSNDIFREESVSSTVEELSELIDRVREERPDAAFLVAQLIPTAYPSTNRVIRELNAAIPSLASKSSDRSPVWIVDHFTGFDPERMTYDGVHPNEEGEIHMADRWLEALNRYFDERERR